MREMEKRGIKAMRTKKENVKEAKLFLLKFLEKGIIVLLLLLPRLLLVLLLVVVINVCYGCYRCCVILVVLINVVIDGEKKT